MYVCILYVCMYIHTYCVCVLEDSRNTTAKAAVLEVCFLLLRSHVPCASLVYMFIYI